MYANAKCVFKILAQDHLNVTWKVTDGIHQHLDVLEKNKVNAFSLGQSLMIGNEEFEDLDEIIGKKDTLVNSLKCSLTDRFLYFPFFHYVLYN